MGKVEADTIARGHSNVPCPLLAIGVNVREVGGCNPSIHFLQLDEVTEHPMGKGEEEEAKSAGEKMKKDW